MKEVGIGDLVRVDHCGSQGPVCGCFFCWGQSNCIGFVLAPAELNMWHVMFDIGEWKCYDHELEVINGNA